MFQRHRGKHHKEIHLCLFFLDGKHREPQSINAKLFLPIIPIGIVAYALTLLWDNLCRNSCIEGLCINQFQRCPSPPPGNRGAFAHVASPGCGALAILSQPRGLGISIPRGDLWAFDTSVFEIEISFFYREGRGLCQRLACPSGTRKTCRCF